MAQSTQNSLHFDGVNDRVVIPDNDALDMTNNYTLEAWVYPTQFINGAGILSKWQTTNGRGYMLRLAGTSGGVTIDERNTTTNVLTLYAWNHIAAVNNNGTRKLYINGVEVALGSSSYTVQANTDPIHIGQDYNDNNRIFKGMIDEVRIWNVVRTQAEIQANYQTTLSLPQTGLVAYYGFNQGTPNSSNTGVTTLTNGVSSTGSAIDGALQNFMLSGGLSNWVEGKAFLAPSISYASGSVTFTAGTTISPITLTNSGGYPQRVQVSTISGGSSGSFRDGAANQAVFYHPSGVRADANGNLFVADQYSMRIRKIASDGIVSTIAGNGLTGLVNANGTAARFSLPSDIVQDGSGNMYVADYGNNVIRKITPAGDVSIFAGNGTPGTADGLGTSARFNTPTGIAIDASGNLYVADYGNHKIRKITSSGSVSTLAGNGSPAFANATVGVLASFYYPQGIAVDTDGNVYVADKANQRIRKITSAGVVSTFAGSGTEGTADGSGTAASFNSPSGICLDHLGNLYVTDLGSHRIRKITPSGVVTTMAGSTAGTSDGTGTMVKFQSPIGIATDLQGNMYVCDYQSDRIRSITGYRIDPALPTGLFFDPKTGTISGTPTTPSAAKTYTVYAKNEMGETTTPITITISSAPTVTTGAVSNLTATSATLNASVNANGSPTTGLSFTYSQLADLSVGVTVSTTPGSATGNTVTAVLANISGLAANTTYYYRVSASNTVGNSDGTILSFTTPPTAPNISYPGAASTVTLNVGALMSPLTVSNTGGAPDPMQVSTLAGIGFSDSRNGTGTGAGFSYPQGLALDNSGIYLYVADYSNHKIRRIEIATGVVTTLAGSGSNGSADGIGSAASFSFPGYIALDGSGNLYVSDLRNHKIRKVEIATGQVTTIAGSGTSGYADGAAASARFKFPRGLALDETGSNLFVADGDNFRIRKINLSTGQVTTLAGSGSYGVADGTGTSASFSVPWGLVHDLNGNLYVADYMKGRIRKVVLSTGEVTTIAGNLGYQDGEGASAKFNGPAGLTMDANGNLYVADVLNSRIRKISIATGYVTTLAGKGGHAFGDGIATEAQFNYPHGIVSDAQGTIYIGDGSNHRIRRISKYTISPALPAGLVFNSATGEISGTPTAISPATTYTVKALNLGGTSTTTFTLEVGASMMTTAASSIGESTATTGGTVGSTYTGITERGVVWNTSTGPTIANNKQAEGGTTTGAFSVNLTGLTPNTTYYVRSYVTYGSAVTEYGNEKTFKTNQQGSFADITKIYGDAKFSLTAPTAVSTGAFTYASSNTGVATVSGSEVTIVGAGTTTITATQAATGAYASVNKTLTLTVSKATPSITLNIPTTTTLAAANNMSITASASNGEAVTVTIGSGTATGTLSGSPGSYLLNGVSSSGNLVFNATTAATSNWQAGSKTVTMDVQKNSQAIGFTLSSPVTYSSGLSIPLTATSTTGSSTPTGLTVSFSVVSGPASVSGGNLLVSAPGVVVVRASQSGDATYNPAPDVEQTLTVNPGAPTISGFTPSSATEGDVVTITGTNFQNVTSVKFNATAATSFTVVDATTITAVVGTGHTGAVSVTTTGGTATETGFRYKVTWTGATNTFNSTGNWSGGRVPATDDDIIFSATAASDLELDGDKTVGNVDFNGSSKSIWLGAHNLTIKGNLSMPGNITGNGRVIMAGTSPQTIQGGGSILDLEIANSSGVTLDASGDELAVNGTLISTSGTLNANGKLRLTSNSGGTARVGVVSGTITGDVIAERFMPFNEGGNGRGWRLVSVPVTGTGTLRDFFMNGRSGQDLTLVESRDAETENSGTPIVGHNYATALEATSAGFDWIGVPNQVSSLRYYSGDAGGGSFASSNVPSLSTNYGSADQGYMVFVRGDRKLEFPSTTSASATTIRSTGSLKTGTQTVPVEPVSTSKYTLVGNPYMSVLNLDAFYTTNSAVINPSFWIWDTKITGTQSQGGYVNVYKSGTQWVTNTGSYVNPELIESGMAFFVEPVTSLSASTNISILESHKSSEPSAGLSPFSTDKPDDHGRMYIRLERADAKGQRQIIDGVMADFHTSHKVTLTDMSDREKLRNGISRGALWIPREGKTLSGEGLPWPKDVKQSIPLYMSGVGDQTLLVHINPSGMRDRYVAAWLKDNVLKREVEINMNQPFDYDFIGTGRSDWDSTRFEIVYVEATRPSTGVTLEPDEAAETPSVKLYPNPSKTAEVKLSLRAMAPGAYSVQVLDMTGRLVATSMLEHRSLNGEYRVLQGRLLAPGQYLVRLIDADKQLKETLRMMVE